jgi:hypothetical protein
MVPVTMVNTAHNASKLATVAEPMSHRRDIFTSNSEQYRAPSHG